MPEKPQRKLKVAVVNTMNYGTTRRINFHAAKQYAEPFGEFGFLVNEGCPEHWVLDVDGRYDFNEVVEYIKSCG
jgi:hypothetical protein